MRIDAERENLAPLDWIAVRRDGVIAVHENFDKSILFYGPDGERRASFGREGDGPGEFRRITSAGWLGDTLWVFQRQRNSVTLLSPQFTLVRTATAGGVRPPAVDTSRYRALSSQLVRGLYAGGNVLLEVPFPFLRSQPPDVTTPLQYAHVSARGELIGNPILIHTPDRTVGGYLIPFTKPSVASVSPDGARIVSVVTRLPARGTSGALVVKAQTRTGDLIWARDIPFSADRITRGSLDSAHRSVVQSCTSARYFTDACRAFVARGRESMPTFYSPVDAVIAGNDGSTWMRLRRTPAGRPWLVLDPRGEIAGQVTLPLNVTPLVVEQGHAWVIEANSVGLESVLRLAVRR
jgi:hypothetical protein